MLLLLMIIYCVGFVVTLAIGFLPDMNDLKGTGRISGRDVALAFAGAFLWPLVLLARFVDFKGIQ